MPGVLPSDSTGPARGSPSKKNRLSLKLFQKKEAKRALDFTESQENEQKSSEFRGSEMYVRVSLSISLWLCHESGRTRMMFDAVDKPRCSIHSFKLYILT